MEKKKREGCKEVHFHLLQVIFNFSLDVYSVLHCSFWIHIIVLFPMVRDEVFFS